MFVQSITFKKRKCKQKCIIVQHIGNTKKTGRIHTFFFTYDKERETKLLELYNIAVIA